MTVVQSAQHRCQFLYVLLRGQGAGPRAAALAAHMTATTLLLRSSLQHCCPDLVLSVWLGTSDPCC